MNIKTGQIQYLIFGFLFLAFSIIYIVASVSVGKFPSGPDVVLFGVSVMAFCNAYLYPHFKENDERSRRIKEKGMFISYFFILGYMIVFMGLFGLNMIILSGFQTVSILASLTMMTVFISFVVFAKWF